MCQAQSKLIQNKQILLVKKFNWLEKHFGWVEKKFVWLKKYFGSKIFWGQKNFLGQQKFLSQKFRQFFTSWGVDVLVTRFHVYMKFCAVDDFMHVIHVLMNRSYHNHRIFSHNCEKL